MLQAACLTSDVDFIIRLTVSDLSRYRHRDDGEDIEITEVQLIGADLFCYKKKSIKKNGCSREKYIKKKKNQDVKGCYQY